MTPAVITTQVAKAEQAAAQWYALLSGGEATEEEQQEWARWVSATPEHAAAWQRVQEVVARFHGLPPQLAQATLRGPMLDRRAAVKLLGCLLAAGGALAGARQTSVWQREFASYSTSTGERRGWTLADGTRLTLNASSAVDVLFDARRRLVRLLEGEMIVETGHDPRYAPLPFVVAAGTLEIRALGTRFLVSSRGDELGVSLFEGALDIQQPGYAAQRLRSGQSMELRNGHRQPLRELDPQVTAWEQGLIFAEAMPLVLYLKQLARYRAGVLACDAVAGALRVSGVFALAESDRLLAQLPNILPVRVRYFTRYWVRVEALS